MKIRIFLISLMLFFTEIKVILASESGTVIMYHRFGETEYPSTNTKVNDFIKHLEFLKVEKFNVLPLSRLVSFFENDKPLPDKSVFITIDDGYKSVYEIAYPILKEYNFPFSIFISTDKVSENNNSSYMSWDMIKELSENNVSIENHTSDHSRANKISSERFIEVVNKAERIISSKLGKKSKVFSFPYGESSLHKEKIIKDLGFSIAFSQHSSHIFKGENKFRLPRFAFNEEFGKIERFKMIMHSKPLKVFDILPLDSLINDSKPLVIGFSTTYPLNSINCYNSMNLKMNLERIKPDRIEVRFHEEIYADRIRINCTFVNNKKEIYWYGRMLNK